MGSHRKSIFDSILVGTALVLIAEIEISRAVSDIRSINLTAQAQVNPTLAPVDHKSLSDINWDETRFNSELNQKFQQEGMPTDEPDQKGNEGTRKKEDYSTFASFLVEIIVFFVFLAVLLSLITVCARKCGGNPSASGRIYGPGPIMGGLIADPEIHQEYEPVTAFTNNYGGSIQTSNYSDGYHHYVQSDAPRMSMAQSEYSEYQCEGEELKKSKKSKKKKIPGPTF